MRIKRHFNAKISLRSRGIFEKHLYFYSAGVIISLYIMAGYLDETDLSEYRLVFKNADLLNDEEKQSVQTQIDLLTKGRQVNNNGI